MIIRNVQLENDRRFGWFLSFCLLVHLISIFFKIVRESLFAWLAEGLQQANQHEKDIKKAKAFFATGLLFYILPTPHVVKNGIVKSM